MSNRKSTTSTPRWVIVFVVIVIILFLVFIILHLTGNGFGGHHGYTQPSNIIARITEHEVVL
jgi:hypothetical protein